MSAEFDELFQQLRQAHCREVSRLKAQLAKYEEIADNYPVLPLKPQPKASVPSPQPNVSDLPRSTPEGEDRCSVGGNGDAASAEDGNHGNWQGSQVQYAPQIHLESRRFSEALARFDEGAERKARRSSLEGPQWYRAKWIRDIVSSPRFELTFSVLILLNSILFAVQVQIEGWDAGAKRDLTRSSQTYDGEPGWTELLDIMVVMSNFIGACFAVEVFMKFYGYGPRLFFADWWNWFDSIIVFGWMAEDLGGRLELPISGKALRSFRLLRLLRVLRLLRSIQFCDSLFLLNAAYKGSIGVLTWAIVYLVVLQITLALVCVEGVHGYYLDDPDIEFDKQKEVFNYFGTASRATLTLFEMTLANWVPVCRVMAENVGEWWVAFALVHKLTMGFAFIGIINGVVMQETFKAASQDSNVMVRDRLRAKEKITGNLRQLFRSADKSKDNTLNLTEFLHMCGDPVLKMWLAAIGLSTKDAAKVFYLVDVNNDGELTADEFVDGLERFRGMASGVDMHLLVKEMSDAMHKRFGEQRVEMQGIAERLLKLEDKANTTSI
mmetsp:Transcript_58123/g.138296  ORF Transcript_58123/g.138296 Transcript_58123/m.138296 type:complete len:550 (+) Transcript_58123:120-1769(+)